MILQSQKEYDKKTEQLFNTAKSIIRAEVNRENPMNMFKDFCGQLFLLVEDIGSHDYENNALMDHLIRQSIVHLIFFRQIKDFNSLKKLVGELSLTLPAKYPK